MSSGLGVRRGTAGRRAAGQGRPRTGNRIVVLKDGRIAEASTLTELLERSGHYAELFTLQARGYRESHPDHADERHETEPSHP